MKSTVGMLFFELTGGCSLRVPTAVTSARLTAANVSEGHLEILLTSVNFFPLFTTRAI